MGNCQLLINAAGMPFMNRNRQLFYEGFHHLWGHFLSSPRAGILSQNLKKFRHKRYPLIMATTGQCCPKKSTLRRFFGHSCCNSSHQRSSGHRCRISGHWRSLIKSSGGIPAKRGTVRQPFIILRGFPVIAIPLHSMACYCVVGFGTRAVSRKTPINFITFMSD